MPLPGGSRLFHLRSRILTILVALMVTPLAFAQDVEPDGAPPRAPLSLPEASAALPVPADAATGLFIVGFHAFGALDLAAKAEQYGGTLAASDEQLGFAVYNPRDPREFVRRAREDPNVRYVEEEGLMGVSFLPNDANFSKQYGPQNVGAPLAWDTTLGNGNAAVCVVDTGVRYTHEDLNGTRWKGGHDFVNNDADPMDDNGHGTHVAGTAAASLNNGKGIAGMANVSLYGVKVLSASGSGSWSGVASGIRWCADNTVARTVISLSLGGPQPSTTVHDALKYAVSKGKLVVAAAGNDGCAGCVGYPAAHPEAIAVGCTTASRTLCTFSSRGPEVDLSAPGHNILSAWHTGNGSYQTISGTSMSTPHVSGAAALIWSKYTNLTAADLRVKLEETARDLGPAGWDSGFGLGELNVSAAIVPRVPGVVRDLNASSVGAKVEVAWMPPAVQGGAIKTYQVYRGNSTANLTLLANVSGAQLGYADATCGNLTQCRYAVRAVNVFGPGPLSANLPPKANAAPVLGTLACAPATAVLGQATTCSLTVKDESIGVSHNVTWGDGTFLQSPASGYTKPGPFTATRTFQKPGTYKVNVTVVDTGGAKTVRSQNVTVVAPNDCGTGVDAGNTFASATWLKLPVAGCTGRLEGADGFDFYAVNLTAGQKLDVTMTPNGQSDYDLCFLRPDGTAVPCPYVDGNGTETLSHTADVSGAWRIRVWNYSGGGPYTMTASASAPPANAAPQMRSITCLDNPARKGDTTTCLFKATDDSAGVSYTVSWGDGSAAQRVPASGHVRPGTTQSATHVWAGAGTFTVTVTATDASGATSTSVSTLQFVDP